MKLNFISFDEINKDFFESVEQKDENIFYDEISNILSSSSEESSLDNKNKSFQPMESKEKKILI